MRAKVTDVALQELTQFLVAPQHSTNVKKEIVKAMINMSLAGVPCGLISVLLINQLKVTMYLLRRKQFSH